MTLNPISWGRQRRDAGHYLVAASHLSEHDRFLQDVVLGNSQTDLDLMDIDSIEDWSWSSGEKTLVDLFLTCAGYIRKVTIADVMNLDEPNKLAASNAIQMMCAPADRWDTRTASYREAF